MSPSRTRFRGAFIARPARDPREDAAEFVGRHDDGRAAVLVHVVPARRHVQVVATAEAGQRIDDDTAARAVAAMTERFREGDLAGGIEAGLAVLAG